MLLFPGFVVLLFYQASRPVHSTCTQLSHCACENKDGGIVNLTRIASTQTDKGAPFTSKVDVNGAVFYYNPCFSFTQPDPHQPGSKACTPDENVAVCQKNDDLLYNVGTQKSVRFSGSSGNNLKVTYASIDASQTTRISVVELKCDESVYPGTLASSGEKPKLQYNLVFTSKCCCPDACETAASSSSSGSGLSVGSILLIVFFVLLVVYFVGGVLYLKFYRGAEGVELVPNYTFWVALPALIKGGVLFLIGKCKGTDSNSTQYEKI